MAYSVKIVINIHNLYQFGFLHATNIYNFLKECFVLLLVLINQIIKLTFHQLYFLLQHVYVVVSLHFVIRNSIISDKYVINADIQFIMNNHNIPLFIMILLIFIFLEKKNSLKLCHIPVIMIMNLMSLEEILFKLIYNDFV